MQALLACCAFYSLSLLDTLLRWARGGAPAPGLTRPLHAAAPLLYALSAFVAAAFYTCIWPDAAFQAAHVAPKARFHSAAQLARISRSRLAPQEAAGLPVAAWLHEVHAGPLLLAVLDLAGGRDAAMLAAHTPRALPLAAAALATAAAYWALLLWAAVTTGAWPYDFLWRMSDARRIGFATAAGALLALLALAFRAAALRRAALAAAYAERLKKES